jgi:hypothetical protein
MADQSISCPSCNRKIPLTRALRAEIETSLKQQFDDRERELKHAFDRQRDEDVQRVWKEAAAIAERQLGDELTTLRERVAEQKQQIDEARAIELALRKRERDLDRRQQDLQVTVARQLDDERQRIVADTQARLAEAHRLKDVEKERQLADMRRQIEDLKRKADQGSQQQQGEAGEEALETLLRSAFPSDEIVGIGQGVRGADVHQVVVDARGRRCGGILWECKNARTWSDGWIAKLKQDQRALHADVAVLVSSTLPKGCARFALTDGVVVTDFASATALAAVLRQNLLQLAQARSAALHKEEKLELLYRYLSGIEFRQRVEAVVEAFAGMRQELEQERRAAERQWARRARQIEAVTFSIAGMYGDLQGLVPLPPIPLLELPGEDIAGTVNDAQTLPF